MASKILFSEKVSSLQLLEFAANNENKENSGAVKSILENDFSNNSLDKCNALSIRYENGQETMLVCENEKSSHNSDVSSISCDICGKYFKSIYCLREHHFICMKDKQIEYTDCDKPFSNNDVHKIHLCKHLYLNGSQSKLHPNLISESDIHFNEKFDSIVSENNVEVVKNVGCDNADDNILSNRHTIVKSVIEENNMQNSTIENVTDSNNPEEQTRPVNELSVSVLVCDFKQPSNPDVHHDTCSNDKSYSFSESDKEFSEHLNKHLKKRNQKESNVILLKNSTETLKRKNDTKGSVVKKVCYRNDKKTSGDKLPVSKPSLPKFTCEVCGQKFLSQSNLNSHCDTHTNSKLYNFTECDKQYSHVDVLKKDEKFDQTKNLDKPKKVTCKVCQKSFAYQTRLNRHFRIHTNAREFKCTLCGKGFNQKNTLASHMLTHTGEKPHQCTVCTRRFSTSSSLSRHLQRHSGDKPHQCDVCCYRFALRVDLKKHYRRHTGELPFQCDICQKRFRRRSGLNAHVAAHTGNLPHKCDICKKGFFHKYALKLHLQVHTNDKMFSCNICDKSFKTKSRLKLHFQVHTGEKPFVCTDCNKAFINKAGLDRHILIHTGTQPYECKICKRLFSQNTSLQRHQVVHTKEKPYSCDVCKKCFTQKSYLSIHKLKHTKKT